MTTTVSASKQDVTACILCSRNCGLSVEIEDNQFKKLRVMISILSRKGIFVKRQLACNIIKNMQID